ncbi:MAG: FkbM family methyltransferase [Prosthecobacter sp.]
MNNSFISRLCSRKQNLKSYKSQYGGLLGAWEYARLRLARKGSNVLAFPPGSRLSLELVAGAIDIGTWDEVFITEDWRIGSFSSMPQAPVIVDVGANIGLTAAYFSEHFPDAKIIAIEPENSNFDRLCRNTGKYKNITAIKAALWHRDAPVNLANPNDTSVSFCCVDTDDSIGQIQGITVPELMRRCGLSEIDFLKLDIEGAELELFKGDTTWLPAVRLIGIEFHERKAPGCIEAFENATSATHKLAVTAGRNHFFLRK